MSDLRNAAQQALEALEDDPEEMVEVEKDRWEYKREVAWKVLRAALAQPERQPLTEDALKAEFAKLYKSDAALLTDSWIGEDK